MKAGIQKLGGCINDSLLLSGEPFAVNRVSNGISLKEVQHELLHITPSVALG